MTCLSETINACVNCQEKYEDNLSLSGFTYQHAVIITTAKASFLTLNHYVERYAADVLTISLRNDDDDHGNFALIRSCLRCIIPFKLSYTWNDTNGLELKLKNK